VGVGEIVITLTGGNFRRADGTALAFGSIVFQLNLDSIIVTAPGGQILATMESAFQLDANGNILPNAPATTAQIWSNAELSPQLNSTHLATIYYVTIYDANGARVTADAPMRWQFPNLLGDTVNLGTMTPCKVEP
jgi:hypothetical protein